MEAETQAKIFHLNWAQDLRLPKVSRDGQEQRFLQRARSPPPPLDGALQGRGTAPAGVTLRSPGSACLNVPGIAQRFSSAILKCNSRFHFMYM